MKIWLSGLFSAGFFSKMASASASPNELEANTAVISHTGDLVTIRECFVDGIQKVVVWFYPKASTGG